MIQPGKNNFQVFTAIPQANDWIWCIDLRLPNDYRWMSKQLQDHLGIIDPTPSTTDYLKAIRIFIKFEKQLVDEGYKGWFASTPPNNYKMIKFFDSVGASEYDITDYGVWFQKSSLVITLEQSKRNVEERLVKKLTNLEDDIEHIIV